MKQFPIFYEVTLDRAIRVINIKVNESSSSKQQNRCLFVMKTMTSVSLPQIKKGRSSKRKMDQNSLKVSDLFSLKGSVHTKNQTFGWPTPDCDVPICDPNQLRQCKRECLLITLSKKPFIVPSFILVRKRLSGFFNAKFVCALPKSIPCCKVCVEAISDKIIEKGLMFQQSNAYILFLKVHRRLIYRA